MMASLGGRRGGGGGGRSRGLTLRVSSEASANPAFGPPADAGWPSSCG